jgi:hypothetical protein
MVNGQILKVTTAQLPLASDLLMRMLIGKALRVGVLWPLALAGPKGKQLEGTECPLHVVHPPTGEEFALGCGVCRNAHTF